MTGGHVQGDLLAPEDVVSLLIDDAQLEQKLKEVSQQAKDRLKKKGGTKGIRVDAEGGGAIIEYFTNPGYGSESELPEPDKPKPTNKKRKAATDKQAEQKSRPQKSSKNVGSSSPNSMIMDYEHDVPTQNIDTLQQQRPKRLKGPTKSLNETIEPAFTTIPPVFQDQNQITPVP